MAVHDHRVRLTYDDYLLIPEDGLRHEILDGEHYVCASPSVKHQTVSRRLMLTLGLFIETNRLGEIFSAPIDVVMSFHDVAVPDLVFVSRERLSILTEANVQGAPDLVVEILSKSTRKIDLGIKLSRYELLGVQEYWIADPFQRTITVYRLDEEHFQEEAVLQADREDVLTTPLIPGLEIRLAEIFAWSY